MWLQFAVNVYWAKMLIVIARWNLYCQEVTNCVTLNAGPLPLTGLGSCGATFFSFAFWLKCMLAPKMEVQMVGSSENPRFAHGLVIDQSPFANMGYRLFPCDHLHLNQSGSFRMASLQYGYFCLMIDHSIITCTYLSFPATPHSELHLGWVLQRRL